MAGSITIERKEHVLIASLHNSPVALMDSPMVEELAALARLADQDPTIGAVVLTGGHATRFLAHFDVSEILEGAEQAPRLSTRALTMSMRLTAAALRVPGAGSLLERSSLAGLVGLQRLRDALLAIESCSAVWIAALNGDTGGGGCELALACDFRFMADGPFSIAQPEIFLGFPPGGGGTQRLTRLLGPSKALRICLDGGPLSPSQAAELGLIDRVVAPDNLLDEAVAYAAHLGRRPKTGIGAVKRAVHTGATLPQRAGLLAESAEFLAAISTEDSLAAQRAYVRSMDELGDVPIADPATVATVVERGYFA